MENHRLWYVPSFIQFCKNDYYTQQEFIRKATQSLSYIILSTNTARCDILLLTLIIKTLL